MTCVSILQNNRPRGKYIVDLWLKLFPKQEVSLNFPKSLCISQNDMWYELIIVDLEFLLTNTEFKILGKVEKEAILKKFQWNTINFSKC